MFSLVILLHAAVVVLIAVAIFKLIDYLALSRPIPEIAKLIVGLYAVLRILQLFGLNTDF